VKIWHYNKPKPLYCVKFNQRYGCLWKPLLDIGLVQVYGTIYEEVRNTGRFIMYSGITKIYYRKTVGHVLTKQTVHIEGTQIFFSSKLFFIVVHISAVSSEEYRCTHVYACVARTWISYRCVPCRPWCTHRTSLKLFQFSFGCEQIH
jgi:hypothetical protein